MVAEVAAGTGTSARVEPERIYGDVFERVDHPFIVGDKFGPDVMDFQVPPTPLPAPRPRSLRPHSPRSLCDGLSGAAAPRR